MSLLLNFLRVSHLIDYKPHHYLPISGASYKLVDLPTQGAETSNHSDVPPDTVD